MASKANGVEEWVRAPPPPGTCFSRMMNAIYNPEEHSFLGRTPKRWGIVLTFYLVFYAVLALMFALCMGGLYLTLEPKRPTYLLHESLIGANPGVASRPLYETPVLRYSVDNSSAYQPYVQQLEEFFQRANPGMGHRPLLFEEGALIWYHADNETQVKKYVDNINEFLAPYNNKTLLPNQGDNQLECGDVKPPRAQVCAFDTSSFGPCSSENNFGYANKTPCLIIKLNRLYDWNPDFYDDPGDLPPDMPPDIKNYIVNATAKQRRKVWVSCMGERPADVEALGPLRYYPYPGLPETFFPYDNTPGYLSPLVAVQLLNPTLHQIINIRCRAWARNIVYTESLKERLGSTHLEIMID